MAYLALIRHGESLWNAKGLWTGFADISLSENGKKEAKKAAEVIKDISFDVAFTSVLSRAKETLEIIKETLKFKSFPTIENKALNERDYGEYTGKNKWDIQKEVGEEKFLQIRRGWDVPISHGESLKNVYDRVIPYYEKEILPKLKSGKNVLISAHGNSLRALVKYLERIPDDQIQFLEMATGEVYTYEIDEKGNVLSKEIKNTKITS